jgi:hypothetical protein
LWFIFPNAIIMNESAMNHATPVEVFAGTSWEAALVKSLLENAEIEAFLKDEIRGMLTPWHVSAGGSNPVKVVVSMLDLEKAREVVRSFYENRKSDDEPQGSNF